jgi:phosphoribosylformylglycinamidine synthase
MWQLSEAIDGMAEACRELAVPVVGGNVSLYNESGGRDIDPTPVVGTLGLVDRLERQPPGPVLVDRSHLLLVGAAGDGHPATSLAGSRWAVELLGHRGGRLPALNFPLHRRLVDLVRELVNQGRVDGVHDVSDGGLGVALAEMAARSGVGFRVGGIADHVALFGEGPSRVLVSVTPAALPDVTARVEAAGVSWTSLGVAGGDRVIVEGLLDLSVAEVTTAWRGALPAALAPTLSAPAEPPPSP